MIHGCSWTKVTGMETIRAQILQIKIGFADECRRERKMNIMDESQAFLFVCLFVSFEQEWGTDILYNIDVHFNLLRDQQKIQNC